jgi:hypothetical protein
MSANALTKLVERILAKGADLPLASVLEVAVPVRRLRDLARKFGISPKGGFRIERAPAHVLAPLLAEQRDAARLDEVLGLLLPATSRETEPESAPADGAPHPGHEAAGLLALREAEVARLRDEIERTRESLARAREREAELSRRLEASERDVVVLRQQSHRVEREQERPAPGSRTQQDLQQRVRDLEDERDGLLAADEALRRQLAHSRTRIRELEQTSSELEALVPKGRRRQRQAAAEPPESARSFRLPWFLPSFYKSIEGKDRRSVERAVQAVLLFCTEGHSYPGLEVKQMGGQDTWSLRASLGLRVYFRHRSDGDVEILELADREEQHTTLRRLKDR